MVNTKAANTKIRRVLRSVKSGARTGRMRKGRRSSTRRTKSPRMGMYEPLRKLYGEGKYNTNFNPKKAAYETVKPYFEQAKKSRLLRESYKAYAVDFKKATGMLPAIPKDATQLMGTISPYMEQAASMMGGDIYDLVPSLGGMAGSAFGPEGKIIGEIGGKVIGDFLRWGIEEDGFKKIHKLAMDIIDGVVDFAEDVFDFVEDAASEVGSFFDDAASEVGSFFSDIF